MTTAAEVIPAGSKPATKKKPGRKKALTKTEPSTPDQLLRIAVENDLDTDKLEHLMQLEERYRANQAEAAFAEAMSKFNGLKQNISHNRNGTAPGSTKFSYADYPQMVRTITPWLTECGLSFTHYQDPPEKDGEGNILWVNVYCVIKHVSGHSETNSFPAMPDQRLHGKLSPGQLLQQAITYAKRQTLAMGLGLATAEDKNDHDSVPPDGDYLTSDQLADIKALMSEVKADEAKFLSHFKINSINDLPGRCYKRAVAMLEAKRT